MIEIAIALAVIAFALVAIIGVLPIGMNVQRDNRAETIINHDANIWMEAIRGGARGLDDLTNYVDQITVFTPNGSNTYENFYLNPGAAPYVFSAGNDIIGLLSTPGSGTNWATVRTLSGAAPEKNAYKAAAWPGQDVAVRYRLSARVVPVDPSVTLDFNSAMNPNFNPNPATGPAGGEPLNHTLYNIELRFSWPVINARSIGTRQKTYRSMASRYLAVQSVTNNNTVIDYFHLTP